MAALVGYEPKLCRLNHWLSAAPDTDPAHLCSLANVYTNTQNRTYSPPSETRLNAHQKRQTDKTPYPWHPITDLDSYRTCLTGNNNVLHSICLYLFYVLSIGFRVHLYEDYGTLKSKCPCLTWLKWLLLFASWVRPHFTISERCPGRHKTNEKAKVFKGREYERRECSMMCQSLGTPRLLCMYSIFFCLPFVQLCEAIRNPRVQAFSFKYTTNGC